MGSLLEDTVSGFYEDLDAGDTKSQKRLGAAYQRAIDAFVEDANAVAARVGESGLGTSYEYTRLQVLTGQAGAAFAELGAATGATLTDYQGTAVDLAQKHVDTLLGISARAIPQSFVALPKAAITQLVASMGDGSPLRMLTQSFAGDAANLVNRALIQGIASGLGADDLARKIAKAASDDFKPLLTRANTIARTEGMRVYREATRRTAQQHPNVFKGWTWFSFVDKNTCPVCWANHGKVFKLQESMATHPNCRCTMIPKTYSWKELGFSFDDVPQGPNFRPGEEIFAELDEVTQRGILGRGGFTAWKNKLVTLDDFVQDTYSPEWGYGRTTRSLRSMVGSDNARMLSAGRVPSNLPTKSFSYTPPNYADPYNLQKIRLKDAVETGKLPQSQADNLLGMLDKGFITDPATLDDLIKVSIEQPAKTAHNFLDKLDNFPDTTAAEKDFFLDKINGATNYQDMIKVQDEIKAAIQAKEQAAKAQFDILKQQAKDELDLAYKFGNISKNDLDYFIQEIDAYDWNWGNQNTIQNWFDTYQTKNTLVNPFNDLLDILDEAKKLGEIDDFTFNHLTGKLNAKTLDISDAKAFTDFYKKKVDLHSPTSGPPGIYSPDDWDKVLDLHGKGKLTTQELDALYDQYNVGLFTKKDFTEYVDNLVVQKNKVTKPSWQLLDELDTSHYPQAYKDQIKQQYKAKIINKEQMQDILDKAPSAPAKPYDVAGKFPYKKHQTSLKMLKNKGVIDQDFIDQIYAGYQKGYLKNKDIEKIIDAKQSGMYNPVKPLAPKPPTPTPGTPYQGVPPGLVNDPRAMKKTWDYRGFIGTDHKGLNGRGGSWFNQWKAGASKADRDIVTEYTGSLFRELNKWNRMGRPKSSPHFYDIATLERKTDSMDRAMSNSIVPEDIVVIRNSKARSQYAPGWTDPKPGNIIWDDGYMSTSVDMQWSGFTQCGDGSGKEVAFQLVLSIPKGSNALWAKPISNYTSENEVVIPRAAKLEIVEVEEFTDYCGHTAKRIFAKMI